MSQGKDWEGDEAYIMGSTNGLIFFMITTKGLSAVLRADDFPAETFQLGDLYKIAYVPNKHAQEKNNTRHNVTRYQFLSKLPNVRIDKGHVYIRATARYEKTFTDPDGRPVNAFYNNDWGMIFDLPSKSIVKSNAELVDLEFKSKASPADRFRSIFVVSKVFGYPEMRSEDEWRYRAPEPTRRAPQKIETFAGIITEEARERPGWYVWITEKQKEIFLEPKYCPHQGNIAGVWIELEMDGLDVINTREIPSVFPSRARAGVTEVFVVVEHRGRYQKTNFDLYYNEALGYIADPAYIISATPGGSFYETWVEKHNTPDTTFHWRVSVAQDRPLPLDDPPRNQQEPRKSSPVPFRGRSNHGENWKRSPDDYVDNGNISRMSGRSTSPTQHSGHYNFREQTSDRCRKPHPNEYNHLDERRHYRPEFTRSPSPRSERKYGSSVSSRPRRSSPDRREDLRIQERSYEDGRYHRSGSPHSDRSVHHQSSNRSRYPVNDQHSATESRTSVSGSRGGHQDDDVTPARRRAPTPDEFSNDGYSEDEGEVVAPLTKRGEFVTATESRQQQGGSGGDSRIPNGNGQDRSTQDQLEDMRGQLYRLRTIMRHLLEKPNVSELLESTDPDYYEALKEVSQMKF